MRPLFVLCLMQSKGVWQYIMYNTCISIRFTFSTPCHCFWSALTTMLAQTKKNCLWMRSPTSLSNAQLVRQLKWLTLKECGGGWYETDHADAMMVVWGKTFHKWGKPLSKSTILSLKGSSPKKILLLKPHIWYSNGVWYSSIWSEGPKNQLNLKILVSKFVPRDLERQGTRGLEGQRTDLKGWRKGFEGKHFFFIVFFNVLASSLHQQCGYF